MSETEPEPEPGHVSLGRLYASGAAAFRASSLAADTEEPEQPRLTADELFDARTACASVYQAVLDDSQAAEYRLQQPWPHVRPGVTASIVDILQDVQRSEESAQDKKRRKEAYKRTRWYQQRIDFLEGSFKSSASASDTSSDDDQLSKRARPDMQSDKPFWTCMHHSRQRYDGTVADVQACKYDNHFTTYHCAACGAARWDGSGGQLESCTAAAFQTADLDKTSTKQLLARVQSSTKSQQGAGLHLPRKAIRAEISKHASKVQLVQQQTGTGWPLEHQQQPAVPAIPTEDLLPLSDNETSRPVLTGNARLAPVRLPSSFSRPQPSRQTDAFSTLQTAILDLNSDIRLDLQPSPAQTADQDLSANHNQDNHPGDEMQDADSRDNAAPTALHHARPGVVGHEGQIVEQKAQNDALEASATAQAAAAAKFANGLLRFLMLESQGRSQLS